MSIKLLVRVKGDGRALRSAMGKRFAAAQSDIRPIFEIRREVAGFGMAPATQSTWLRVAAPDKVGWDAAHELVKQVGDAAQVELIEPDTQQQWYWTGQHPTDGMAAAPRDDDRQDTSGGQAAGPRLFWNLDDDFSQLKQARAKVGDKQARIRIAHLDTGYDPAHVTVPRHLRGDLQVNFADDRDEHGNAADPPPGPFNFLNNHGHGTGTLSILAGDRVSISSPEMGSFDDLMGGAPFAEIIPIRIADSVVRFSTGTIVQGIDHALKHGAHVLSMSMGGVGSNALVDAVNAAYEKGLVMVTAAGNNISGMGSPSTIVFPARFLRVIAACGVMADGRAYDGLDFGTMQGNYGPEAKMAAALGAYRNGQWGPFERRRHVFRDAADRGRCGPLARRALGHGETL
jgi:subtilisin family serine protease